MVICRTNTPNVRRGNFHSGKATMPDQLPIPDDEWLFDNVPDEQLFDAVVWEYCRTQEWIINAVKSAPIKSSRPMQKEAAEDVEFGS